MSREMLTVQEYANLMGFNSSSVRRMCEKGRIPCQKVGGRWRISVDSSDSDSDERPSKVNQIDSIANSISDLISALGGLKQSLVELKEGRGDS